MSRITSSAAPSTLCACKKQSSRTSIHSRRAPSSPRASTNSPSSRQPGGIITAWNPRLLHLVNSSIGAFTISTKFELLVDASCLVVSCIYAPCMDNCRPAFLDEVLNLASTHAGYPWLLLGDFNLVRDPEDQNNNFDAGTAALFNATIEAALL